MYFPNGVVLQNNLASIVNELRVFNHSAFKRVCRVQLARRRGGAKMFDEDDVGDLVDACKSMTLDYIPSIVSMVKGIGVVDCRGYGIQ